MRNEFFTHGFSDACRGIPLILSGQKAIYFPSGNASGTALFPACQQFLPDHGMAAFGTFQGGAFHPAFMGDFRPAFCAYTVASGAKCAALIPSAAALSGSSAGALTGSSA